MTREEDIDAAAVEYIADGKTKEQMRVIMINLDLGTMGEQTRFISKISTKPLLLESFLKEIIKVSSVKTDNNKKLSKEIQVFQGTHKEDFNQWLFTIDIDIDASKLNDNSAGIAICQKLKGTPLYKYQTYYKECKASNKEIKWSDFKTILIAQYQRTDTEFSLRRNLRTLKKKNFQNINEFNDEFLRITHAIGNMSSGEIIDAYVDGLDDETYKEVA